MKKNSQERSDKPKTRIGLIIQGPLTSSGLSGRQFGLPKEMLDPKDFSSHDCLQSIEETLRLKPPNVRAVLATWANQDEKLYAYARSIENLDEVLVFPDPPEVLQGGAGSDGNNNFRQFWLTLEGLKALELDCTHVLKVRTDQSIDLPMLLNEFERVVSSDQEDFLTPIFRKDNPFWLGDFFFGGPIALMRRTLERICKNEGRLLIEIADPHLALYRAFDETLLPPRIKVVESPPTIGLFRCLRVWSHFSVASKELFKSIIWRGEPIRMELVSVNYTNSPHAARRPKYPSSRRVATTYFLFKMIPHLMVVKKLWLHIRSRIGQA